MQCKSPSAFMSHQMPMAVYCSQDTRVARTFQEHSHLLNLDSTPLKKHRSSITSIHNRAKRMLLWLWLNASIYCQNVLKIFPLSRFLCFVLRPCISKGALRINIWHWQINSPWINYLKFMALASHVRIGIHAVSTGSSELSWQFNIFCQTLHLCS